MWVEELEERCFIYRNKILNILLRLTFIINKEEFSLDLEKITEEWV